MTRKIEEICDDLTALENLTGTLNRAYDRAPDGSEAKRVAIKAIDDAIRQRNALEDEINAVLGE